MDIMFTPLSSATENEIKKWGTLEDAHYAIMDNVIVAGEVELSKCLNVNVGNSTQLVCNQLFKEHNAIIHVGDVNEDGVVDLMIKSGETYLVSHGVKQKEPEPTERFGELSKKFKTPSDIDEYMRSHFSYASTGEGYGCGGIDIGDNLKSCPPAYIFGTQKGNCGAHVVFADYFLKQLGMETYIAKIYSKWPDDFAVGAKERDYHYVNVYEYNGKLYIMDNGSTHQRGILGPFDKETDMPIKILQKYKLPKGSPDGSQDFIAVTDDVKKLAEQIDIKEGATELDAYKAIIEFMLIQHNIMINRQPLKQLAYPNQEAMKDEEALYKKIEPQLTFDTSADDVYRRYFNNNDHPFGFTAEEILKYRIGSGCTHAAIAFMALAKARGYEDVRLVMASDNYAYNVENCPGGKGSSVKFDDWGVDSHKVVMARVGDRYGIIDTSNRNFEIIFEAADGKPFTPENIVGRDIKFPSYKGDPNGAFSLMRVRAIGKDNNDYIDNGTNAEDITTNLTRANGAFDTNCTDYPLPIIVPKKGFKF